MAAKRLLFIDNDKDTRIIVKFALERETDWEVLTATDGIDGITIAETERPDVIVLDLIMPGLDGLAVLDVLKSNLFTCSIPVIFLTAMVQNRVISQLDNTLAVGIITKPFDVINLDSQIAEISQWNLIGKL